MISHTYEVHCEHLIFAAGDNRLDLLIQFLVSA